MSERCWLALGAGVLAVSFFACSENLFYFESNLPENITRTWIGPEYWANRLQDWQLRDGRIECIGADAPLRTVHLLTRTLERNAGDLYTSVRTGVISQNANLGRESWAGFLIGAGDLDMDYRARSIIHQSSGVNGGLVAALDGEGHLVFYDNEQGLKYIAPVQMEGRTFKRGPAEQIELKLSLYPHGDTYSASLGAYDAVSGEFLQEVIVEGIQGDRLTGNIALISQGGADPDGKSYWFSDWQVSGSKVKVDEDHAYGPVLGTLFTLSKGTLNLTAQMAPIGDDDPQTVTLQTTAAGSDEWTAVAEAEIVVPGWTALFRVDGWNVSADTRFRLVYPLAEKGGTVKEHYYTGTIPHDPVEKDEIVVAAFTGNSNSHGTFGKTFDFSENRIWFPHAEIARHVASLKPDFLVFTGDQVYESRPTAPDRRGGLKSQLDYMYKWYLWTWAYEGLSREIPAVCLPDDHDVYHGNIWGAGGIAARPLPADGAYPDHYSGLQGHWRQDGGGYLMDPEFVNMVQRTQTGHLPAPYDPTPVDQGITVYYTDINYGGISFAALEDRKFKSAPSVAVPAAKVVNGFPQAAGFNIARADVEGAQLLGERQELFLREWAADWTNAQMKVALSQTVLAAVSTYPEGFRTDAGTPGLEPLPADTVPPGYALSQDMDSNGWPQSGRNRALDALRRGYAFTIAGDQHLGSIVHHGITDWDDAGYSFCVPSVANLWPRRWYPPQPGAEAEPGAPPYTGRFLDGFGNKITVWAVSNPVISDQEPADLHDRAPGYGIVRLNKREQTITMECWPRYADPISPDSKQYPGWPRTISMEENYGRKAISYLPRLEFQGMTNPVVQIVNEGTGEIAYTLRVKGTSFRPKVFQPGTYQVRVGEPGTEKIQVLNGVRDIGLEEGESLSIQF